VPAFLITTRNPRYDVADYSRPLESDGYAGALLERWPLVRIVFPPPNRTSLLQFELPSEDGGGLLGTLHSDEATVAFTIYIMEQALDYIIWHRGLVSRNIPLFFLDEGMDVVEELHRETNRTEIEAWILRVIGPS
jgi:hypothetical protein